MWSRRWAFHRSAASWRPACDTYGGARLDRASCPKKASCPLRLLLWDRGASATLLFVPRVCVVNLGDLSEATKSNVLRPPPLFYSAEQETHCCFPLKKNSQTFAQIYLPNFPFLFCDQPCLFILFFPFFSLASRVWRVPSGHQRERQRVVPPSPGPGAPAAVDRRHRAAPGKSCSRTESGRRKQEKKGFFLHAKV